MNFRILLLFIVIINSKFGNCQELMDWPSLNESNKYGFTHNHHISSLSNIINKAKLLTLLPIGFYETDSLIEDLLNQPYTYYYPDSCPKYMTIIVENDQPLIIKNLQLSKYKNSLCKFTLVYSYLENRFYRIQGFENNNISDFSSSIKLSEYSDFHFFFLNLNDYLYHWDRSLINYNKYVDYLNADDDSATFEICCKCLDTYDTLLVMNPISGAGDSIYKLQILNKAKLMTMSEFGIMPTDSIVKSLFDQKAEIKSYNNKGYYEIIEISNQKFDFTYKLIFCYNTGKFYKIEGFQSNDFLEFETLVKRLGDDIPSLVSEPVSN